MDIFINFFKYFKVLEVGRLTLNLLPEAHLVVNRMKLVLFISKEKDRD